MDVNRPVRKGREEKVLEKLAIVAFGGGLGAALRFWTSQWAANRFGADFPYGTLIVNVSGCFMIGCFMVLSTERFLINPYWRLVFSVGFLGGLTTFSSYSYETLELLRDGSLVAASLNAFLNLLLGFGAAWLGMAAARII